MTEGEMVGWHCQLDGHLWCFLVLAKGDQSWVFIGRTDVEAETPIPDVKS